PCTVVVQCDFFKFEVSAAGSFFSFPFHLYQHVFSMVLRQRAETMFSFAANPVLAVKNDVHVIIRLDPEEMLDRIPCDKERHLWLVFAVPIDKVVILIKQYGVSAKYDAAIQ